jgi:hypothetical protein
MDKSFSNPNSVKPSLNTCVNYVAPGCAVYLNVYTIALLVIGWRCSVRLVRMVSASTAAGDVQTMR